MYNCKQFLSLLEGFAPLSLSQKMVEKGSYDNSGLLIKNHDRIQKILFTLDLSEQSVSVAKELCCDTIVTHHPAIFTPISEIGVTPSTKALLDAVKGNLNVFSMHLNLDIAKDGIDQSLSLGLKGKNQKVIEIFDGELGYGKQAEVDCIDIEEYVEQIKKEFGSNKIIYYGQGVVESIASFCGAGSKDALKAVETGSINADTVISSDIPHHVLLGLIQAGKKVIILPHYVAENYGFNKFYANIKNAVTDDVKAYYFTDKRFM